MFCIHKSQPHNVIIEIELSISTQGLFHHTWALPMYQHHMASQSLFFKVGSFYVFITLSKHQAKLKYVLKQIKADSLYNLIECISTDIGFAPLTLTICVFSWATLHVYWQRSGDGEVELHHLAARPRLQLYYDDGGQSVSVSCFNHRKNVKTSLSKYFPSISHIQQ